MKLKGLAGRLPLDVYDEVDTILDTPDEETQQRTRESMDQIYQKLAEIDEEIKLMVESIAPNKFYVGDDIEYNTYKFNLQTQKNDIPITYRFKIREVDLGKNEYSVVGQGKESTISFEDAHNLYHRV